MKTQQWFIQVINFNFLAVLLLFIFSTHRTKYQLVKHKRF